MMTPLMMVTAAAQRKSVALETPQKHGLNRGESNVIGKKLNPLRMTLDGLKQEKQGWFLRFKRKKKSHIKIIKV